MISLDQSILSVSSEARERMRAYAGLTDELHVIVANMHSRGQEHHEGALHVYPTNSSGAVRRVWDTFTRARAVMTERTLSGADVLLTTQEPFEIGLVGVLLRNKFRVKLQVQCHVDFLNPYFFREKILNMVRGVIALQVLRRADGIRVVSERIKSSILARIKNLSPEKISVLPIFVDIAAAHTADTIDLHKRFPQFKKIILMASRITNEKQIPWACEALQKIVGEFDGLGVVVLGDGPQRAAVEKFPFVRAVGWVSDVTQYMKGADIFLNASLYEGYGRTLVQAAAVGMPTITTDVGVAREIFEHGKTGMIIPVRDEQSLQRAVRAILSGDVHLSTPKLVEKTKAEYLQDYKKVWSALVARSS